MVNTRTVEQEDLCTTPEGAHSIAVSKALQLLNAFDGVGDVCGVSEISRRAKLPKSTTHRLLAQLIQSNFVTRTGDRYRLSLHVFGLGNRTLGRDRPGIREMAGPYLGDLFLRFSQTVHLGVLHGVDVLYLDKLSGHGSPLTPTRVGGQLPATTTAIGKAMLSFSSRPVLKQVFERDLPRLTRNSVTGSRALLGQLRQARAEGVAYDWEEAALGVVCVAAPILVEGRQVAAISVSGRSTQLDVKSAGRYVIEAAQSIGDEVRRHRSISLISHGVLDSPAEEP